jgi:hypothetical protein
MFVQLTTNLTVAMNGVIQGLMMKKKSGSQTATSVEAKKKQPGNKLSTMVARLVALIIHRYTIEKTYKKENLKSKYDIT